MAINTLAHVYDRSGSGFEQKLRSLSSIGQSLQQSQQIRDQMAMRLASERQLIADRTEAQFNLQQRVETEINAPLRQQQTQQQQIEFIRKADEAANERVRQLVDNHSKNYSKVSHKYNLWNPWFHVGRDEQGMPEVQIYDPETQSVIDEQTYRAIADSQQEIANRFERLEEGVTKGWFPEQYQPGEQFRNVGGQQVQRLTRANAADILSDIRRDPELARAWGQRLMNDIEYPNPYIEPEDVTSGGGSSGGSLPNRHGLATFVGFMRDVGEKDEYGAETGIINFERIEGSKWFGLRPEQRHERHINFTNTNMETMLNQTNEIATEVFDLDFDMMQTYPQEVVNQIRLGIDDGLRGDERDLARKIARYRDEGYGDQIDTLFHINHNIKPAVETWRNRTGDQLGATVPLSRIYPNFIDGTDFSSYFTTDNDVTSLMYRQQASTR